MFLIRIFLKYMKQINNKKNWNYILFLKSTFKNFLPVIHSKKINFKKFLPLKSS